MQRRHNSLRDDLKGLIRGIESFLEIIVMSISYYLIWRNHYNSDIFPDYYYNGKYVLMGVYAILLYFFYKNLDCFLFGHLKNLDIIIGQWIALFATNFVTYFQLCLIANHMISPIPILILFALQIVFTVAIVIIYSTLFHKLFKPHNIILIYGTDNAVSMKIKMDTRRDKYKVDHLISIEEGIDKICQEVLKYDSVVLNDVPAEIRNDILKFCYKNRIKTYVAPKLTDIIVRGGYVVNLFDTPLLLVNRYYLTLPQRFMKRALDIVLSAIMTIIAAPIMLLVAIAIKTEDGGPIFYKQKRLTINDKEFSILKFRSMIVDAEKHTGSILASGNDPRITKVGKFIRATRLDEIPQILNILKGDMSIVGPRPERKSFVEQYSKDMPEFSYRTKVKGGLTGYAQIYGKYNTSPYDKLRLDLMYIENYSFLLDIKLIILTVKIIFSKESTEGIDVAIENEKLKNEIINNLQKENNND